MASPDRDRTVPQVLRRLIAMTRDCRTAGCFADPCACIATDLDTAAAPCSEPAARRCIEIGGVHGSIAGRVRSRGSGVAVARDRRAGCRYRWLRDPIPSEAVGA